MAEDPRIVVTTEAIIRNMEGFVPNQGIHNVNSPRVRPVIYPVTVNTDTGLGFGNPNLGWYAHHAMPISPGGIGDNPNFVYQVGGGIPENHNLVNRVGGAAAALGGSGQYLNYVSRGGCGVVENPTYVNQAGGGMSQNPSPTGRVGGGHGGSATFDSRSNVGDQASEDGVDDQYPGEKVKFLCSFGGKILRRPSDGLLRYAGGHTRIISVSRDISFQDLVHKMNDVCGKPVVIKYQLPDGELDALVSVSCPEDLENMMEEYEKLVESPSTGSAKLRVFLFPTSEFDPSGLGQFSDLLDSGQRYVDAVNGIPDGVGGGLTRKVSIGSVGSAQNSDGPVGGNDSVDSYTYAQGDGGGVSSPSMSSPRVAASHDSPTSVVYVAPKNVVYAPSMAVGSPTVFTSLPQTFSSLPTERPLAAMGQPYAPLGYDLQKPSGMDYRPATAYMQAYVDPHQQLSSQVGYMSPQGVGISGSIYRYADPPSQLSQQHFMPAVPMSMTTMDPHAAMNTSAGPHVMQPPQTRVDPYHGDNAFKARVVQFPVEQNCHVYQPQSPPQQPTVPLQVGSSCGLMPPSTQHVVLSDGRSFRPQGITPEKPPHLEDCFMCQKALPHAHSDAVVQGQRTCISSTVSDAHLGSQPLNRVVVSGALGEVVCQGSTNQSRPMAQMDHVTSELGRSGFSQDLEFQSEKDRILQKLDVPDNPGVSQGVIGRATDVKSPYGVSHHEDGSPQSSVPHLCHVRQEPIANISVGSDFPPVDTTSSKNLKPLVHESSTEYSGKRSGLFVKEDIPPFWISYDPVRPFEGRVETTHVIPPQVIRSNEPSSSPFYNHQREDVPVTRSQIPGQEMFPTYVKPGTGINPDRNNIMQSGIMPSSSSEVAHFNGSLPLEPNQITKPVMLAISSPCPQPSMGTQHMTSEELLHGKPGSDSDYATYKNISVGKPEAEASGFQSGIVPDAMGCSSRPSSCDTSSSYRGMFGENWEHSPSNSLFSNQDPWTSQHYSQFVHPKANKDGSNEESFITKGELHQPSGNLNNYSCSENFRSNKDKAEECNRQELKSVTEEVPRKASGHLNKDSCTENIQSNKDVADEYIRQELKAVAEGVAAMVLQPPIPSDSYAHGMSETSSEISGRVPDSGAEGHMAAKVEDVKTKLAEKENAGLPLTEGIGRLQIIKNSDLEVLRELGSGTFGTVYHGKWRGSDVAIKRINNRCFSGKPSEQSRMIDDFWNEAINLADLHHPNVVAFYGVVLDGPGDSVATVTEFMVNGSLRHALQRTFDKRKRLLIAMDVAFGMEYLHGKNIVHFDLKSDNLLVNLRDPHRPICKVGDLGLSKVKCNTLISGGVRGTLPWMAPELLNGSSSLVSEKVDVFSFGIVMWELLTGEEPYGDLHYGVIIGGIVSNTLRPPVPESCDPEWRSLMERCWSSDPSERPSFKEISDILRSMSSSLS